MYYSLWIDWIRRIVSFQEVDGFEELHYETHQEMLNFAVGKGLHKEDTMYYSLWIDWIRRIVSFQEVDGFEELHYETHQEMLNFAVGKGFDGFAIQ